MQMCEKKGTLAFGEKGSIIESFLATSLPLWPLPRSYVSARKRLSTIVRKVRGCFGFSLFIGSRHHYPPVSMSYEAMLFG